ncbi:alpha/beta hydrolase [Nocardioides speluncae]|uniref:alpha/beta hydrolase n=1 Tax=Nocardioides speluncae TaxID=2670337 RepID=UPI000D68D7D4|nr:alpha/beta hydrolase [Nocardioides speluncae]
MTKIVAGLLVLALVLAALATAAYVLIDDGDNGTDDGVRSSDRPRPDLRPTADSGEGAPKGLEEYYSQDLQWEDCDEHECAKLKVPLDYAKPGGEQIEIALLRVPAPDDRRIGSLVVNPGGPGAPGTTYAAQARQVFRDPLLEHYDIVGFDPRGTGDSAAVDCLGHNALDEHFAIDPSPDDAAERKAFAQEAAAFGAGCARLSAGVDAHVSTVEAARDLDVLRAVLGQERLDYLGASYGTKLGATYADLFPDRVGRLVLDGAVDPALSSRDASLQQAEGFETALNAYIDHCVDGGDCFLGSSREKGLDRLSKFLDDVDAEPVDTDDPDERDLTIGYAFYGIAATLYNQDYWELLTPALASAFDGDGTLLLSFADAYASRGPGGYTDNSSEAFLAISCLDDPWSLPVDKVAAQVPAFEKVAPTFGEIFAYGMIFCGGFEHRSPDARHQVRAAGADPILVTGTTRDPATPLKWAEALASQLESAVLIRRDGDGHTAYNSGNECVDEAIESYLLDGTVPTGTLDC